MYDIVLCVYERFRVDGLKRCVNDDRFRVDGDKNMRLLAFAFTIVFVWTGSKSRLFSYVLRSLVLIAIKDCFSLHQEKYSRLLVFPVNVFLAFSRFEISILKRVCHEFYAAPWPQKIRQYKQRLDENRKHDC